MKKSKLTVSMLCVAALGASAFSFVGCGETEAAADTVMNVGVNPQVEFVLDTNDKVVSVNALNEDGNIVISAEAFANVKGMAAADAAKLFVEVSKENGFIVEGNATLGTNEVSISISGDSADAEKLYDAVKGKVETYLSDEGLSVTVGALVTITEEELETLIEQCAPYIEETKVQAMSYSELLKTLAQSRKETAEYYSQELKEAYYEAKANAMELAELQALKDAVPVLGNLIANALETGFKPAMQALENARYEILVSETGIYQTALAAFREAKTEFLRYRAYVAETYGSAIPAEIEAQLDSFEEAMTSAQDTLEGIGASIDAQLSNAQATLESSRSTIMSSIQNLMVNANDYLDAISKKQKEALTDFTTDFETKYKTAKDAIVESWSNMRGEISVKYTPNVQ